MEYEQEYSTVKHEMCHEGPELFSFSYSSVAKSVMSEWETGFLLSCIHAIVLAYQLGSSKYWSQCTIGVMLFWWQYLSWGVELDGSQVGLWVLK